MTIPFLLRSLELGKFDYRLPTPRINLSKYQVCSHKKLSESRRLRGVALLFQASCVTLAKPGVERFTWAGSPLVP
jgi:hypothetical protein